MEHKSTPSRTVPFSPEEVRRRWVLIIDLLLEHKRRREAEANSEKRCTS